MACYDVKQQRPDVGLPLISFYWKCTTLHHLTNVSLAHSGKHHRACKLWKVLTLPNVVKLTCYNENYMRMGSISTSGEGKKRHLQQSIALWMWKQYFKHH